MPSKGTGPVLCPVPSDSIFYEREKNGGKGKGGRNKV